MYVSDALRVIGKNTAKYAGGRYIEKRWVDIIDLKPKETRTAEEIIAHRKKRLAET